MIERRTKQKSFWSQKAAEVSGTAIMPHQPTSSKDLKKEKSEVRNKTAMDPYVNMCKAAAAPVILQEQHEHYALPSMERYPLDSYEQVKQASAYYDQWGTRFSPEQKREYCHNLVKRASSLGVEVSSEVARYGADTYAPDVEMMIEARRSLAKTAEQRGLLESLAEARPLLPPSVFCHTLGEWDKMASVAHKYNSKLPDPFYSTFGTKVAEKKTDELIMVGEEAAPQRLIEGAWKYHRAGLVSMFGDEFATEYQKDPMGIFKSLPRDQKKMIMRMVSANAPSSGNSQ